MSFNASSELTGTIESRENSDGKWVTSFGAERKTNGRKLDIRMVANQWYSVSEGMETLKIQGVIECSPKPVKEIKDDCQEFRVGYKQNSKVANEECSHKPVIKTKDDCLRFHQRCGRNVKVVNEGKSLRLKDPNEDRYTCALTNRPLRDDELFEVAIEEGVATGEIRIGMSTQSPGTVESPNTINEFYPMWYIYGVNVYKDGLIIERDYLDEWIEHKVGTRLGVKRTSKGDLHLIINGEDKGVATRNVPSSLYGIVVPSHFATQVSIIDR